MRELVFDSICTIHLLIWLFVIFAFLNKKTAYINVYYVIPFIYLIHMLPFHLLEKTKQNLYPDTYIDKIERYEGNIFFVDYFNKLRRWCDNKCTFNPLSPQGLMILGLILSIFRLHPPKYLQTLIQKFESESY